MNKKVIFGQYYTSPTIADFMVTLITKNSEATIFESGVGEGVFIEALLKKGFKNIEACDIDPNNINYVKNLYGEKVKLLNENYLTLNFKGKYDCIIGNPPYVNWNKIEEATKKVLTENIFWKDLVNGEWDLLYAFIIWSIENLKDEGELVYIVPFNWFNSTFAESLRNYLVRNGYFEAIIHFGEYKLFEDCSPNSIIFKYRKSKNKIKQDILVADYESKYGKIEEILKLVLKYFKNPIEENNTSNDLKLFKNVQFKEASKWYLASEDKENFTKKLEEKAFKKVSDYFETGVGLVSGFDDAFRINDQEYDKLTQLEKKHIYEFVKASNCKRFIINSFTKYIYTQDLDLSVLSRMPFIYNKLTHNKESLLKRYINNNKKWWEWATIRNLEIFTKNLNKPKIFVPVMDRSLKSRYSFTDKKVFGSGDVLIITNRESKNIDLKFLLAWLNSRSISLWYSIKGSKSGHRIKYTQSYVSNIPFFDLNLDRKEVSEIYREIIKLVDIILKQKNVKASEIEEKIDLALERLLKII